MTPATITLGLDQLEALGLTFPAAGESFKIAGTAVVIHAATEDPDVDGHIEAASVTLEFVSLTLDADGSRFARNARTMYGGLDPDGGGSTGPFGKLNAPVGG